MPAVAEATRMPSTSTRVCLALAPRSVTEACEPCPPLETILTPGYFFSSEGKSGAADLSISSSVITVTVEVDCAIVDGRRKGVVT